MAAQNIFLRNGVEREHAKRVEAGAAVVAKAFALHHDQRPVEGATNSFGLRDPARALRTLCDRRAAPDAFHPGEARHRRLLRGNRLGIGVLGEHRL